MNFSSFCVLYGLLNVPKVPQKKIGEAAFIHYAPKLWNLLPKAQLAASPVYSVRMFVNIGRSLTLRCSGDPSRDVEWRFHPYGYSDWLDVADLYTGSFSSGNGFQGRVESFHLKDPGNYSLLLSPVVYSDLGIYKCLYIDETEIILSDVKLEIRVPSNVSVPMGMSASLPCFGKINIQARVVDLDFLWKRGGENVYQLLKNTTTYGPRFENRTSVSPEQALYGNMSLTIRQTLFSDEGDYQCFYSSPKERGNPDSASLVVTGHPPQTLTVKAGGLLSIPLYTADPVKVTFSAGLGSDEVLMLDANKGPARFGERCAQRCELLAQNYTLLLRSVTLEDAGVYKVTDPETKKTIGSVSLEVSEGCTPEGCTSLPSVDKLQWARALPSMRTLLCIIPGCWIEKTGRDMQYALCMCTDAPFHFSMLDMHSIRRWWCVLLMERFWINWYDNYKKYMIDCFSLIFTDLNLFPSSVLSVFF